MNRKTAIIVLSDPNTESEEALGRVFNALAAAYDYDQAGNDVSLMFQGAGTRWPERLQRPDHPAAGLYQAVQHTVKGVSAGCANVFGATESAERAAMKLITDNAVPGTPGLSSFRKLTDDGYIVHTF